MSEQKKTTEKPKPPAGTALAKTPPAAAPAKTDTLEEDLLAGAKTFEERQQAYELAGAVRRHLLVKKAAAAIAETGWGKSISPLARSAVAQYLLEIGADPARHAYVLGGNIYLNAEFYKELCAANPDFNYPTTDFIHHDERANAEEQARRKDLRVKWGVPEKAPGACLVTLFYKSRGPFEGVNWAGVRDTDPVGKAEPTKTAETRAYRKAALKAEPAWFRKHPKLTAAESILAQGRAMPHDPEEAPPAIEVESDSLNQIPATATEEAPAEKRDVAPPPTVEPKEPPRMVNHNPSAKCRTEGLHPESECGYERPVT